MEKTKPTKPPTHKELRAQARDIVAGALKGVACEPAILATAMQVLLLPNFHGE